MTRRALTATQVTDTMFGRELRVASGYKIDSTRPRADSGRQVPHYSGVRLKPDWDKRADEWVSPF